jgi:hypothetical protein
MLVTIRIILAADLVAKSKTSEFDDSWVNGSYPKD